MKKFLYSFFIWMFIHADAFGQLKCIIYDFDGLDINDTDLPEGDYRKSDLTYRVAANPLAAADMIGDRVLKINLTWSAGVGVFGRSSSRFVELDPNTDNFNFFFYNPVSNNQNATFDVIITEDDNQSYAYELASDDTWKKTISVSGSSGWQFIAIPLKDFVDTNPGGNGIFDANFSSNKGMLLMTEFRFNRASSGLSNPTFYMDFINFSEGVLPHGATMLDLPGKNASDYCLLGAYHSEPRGQEYLIPQVVESYFPSSPDKKIKYANYFIAFARDGSTVPKEYPGNEVQQLLNNGYTPVITLEPMFKGFSRLDPVQPRLDNIINGNYDAYLRTFADKLKAFNDTVVMRFMHEFNGDWYSWSIVHNNNDPAKFVNAFRHVVDVFRSRGATKVKWMWCINADYFPRRAFNWLPPAYPGNSYVDIVATDVYNNHYPIDLPWWRSFRWQIAESYYYLTKYFPSKPLFICELGCRERFSSEDVSSETKGAWFARMDKELQSEFRKVRGLLFFDAHADQNWLLNSSSNSIQSVTNNIWNDTYYFKSTAVPPPPSSCSGTGTITREVWNGISGYSISSIPVSTTPSSSTTLTIFKSPSNVADNYGQRIRGYICPPVTGNYIFWIASDDNSELWLSTNDQPSGRQKIASVSGWTASQEWTKYASQKSVSKYLVAGQKYYIEALHKESAQGDHVEVGWQLPSGVQERPIPGMRLMPFNSTPPPPPTSEFISAGASWKYLDNGTNQGTAWRSTGFSDATWKTGSAELGYGDGGEATLVSYGTSSTNKYITTYFRKSFSVAGTSGISGMELSLLRDDGAVVYLNGVEVFRSNMPSGTVSYTTPASSAIDGTAESTYNIANISSASLITGTNVIAVEIHQSSVSSSDISFNLKLKPISAPAAATSGSFAIIGDYGSNSTNEAAVANLVKSWQPEYILTVGDNNYPNGAESTIDANIGKYYHDYIYPYMGAYGSSASTNKFFPSSGNHDYVTSGAVPYYNYFTLPGNERYYDFVKGDVHFYAINSNPQEPDGTSATSAQALWLKNKLAASVSKWDIVYFHHAPYCSDSVHMNSALYMNWPFQAWGADAVIAGHAHIYERIIKNGFPYIVNGLGGQSKYGIFPNPVEGSVVRYSENYGAMKVDVKTDSLRFRFYNISNTLIDDYSLYKPSVQRSEECFTAITPLGPLTFCDGGSVLLKADTTEGLTYQWIVNEKEIPGAESLTYEAKASGNYQVKVNNNGCTAWSAPIEVAVTNSLSARITIGGNSTICGKTKIPLYANTCSDYLYQWKRDGEDLPGETSATYYAEQPGSYQVMILSGSSIAWSALAQITLEDCGDEDSTNLNNALVTTDKLAVVPIRAVKDFFRVSVYPNPTTGLFTFDFCLEDDSQAELEVRVLNSVGQTVYRAAPTKFSGCIRDTIELSSSLATGVYFLQIRIGSRTENVKLLLNR
ncbi:MAG: hypothetical protein K0Q95_2292 [Bacteroidota bacterium]|jgi:hypothetical protein|nr:hypothetical protein [Bacteroidota bacterium]